MVKRRTDRLLNSGVEFVLNCNIGTDLSFADLRQKHDAVFIGTGVYKARRLNLPNCGSNGVIAALDYLTASNRVTMGTAAQDVIEAVPDGLNAKGKTVVVIGGGDTAMDCVRTAIRQGAKHVTCLYRRDRANMPGSEREVNNAEEEGVVFEWLKAPKAIMGDAEKVTGVLVQAMRLTMPDQQGRQGIEEIPESEIKIPADLIIEALGFEPEDLPVLFDEPNLPVSRWGTVTTLAGEFATGLEGVFAGGDIVRGASLVVWAVRQGQDAAKDIHNYLQSRAEVSALHAAE